MSVIKMTQEAILETRNFEVGQSDPSFSEGGKKNQNDSDFAAESMILRLR